MSREEAEDIRTVREAIQAVAKELLVAHGGFNRGEVAGWPTGIVAWLAPAIAVAHRASIEITLRINE